MTQFGVAPSSTSPAAKRIYEAGRAYAARRSEDFARQAREMREALARQAELRRAAEIEARRRVITDRMELAVGIARTLPRAESVKGIMAEVCALHGISIADMLGPSRYRRVVHARQHAMWLCHKRTRLSTTRLGTFFHRDHTTVLHGIQAHEAREKKITHSLCGEPHTNIADANPPGHG